MDQLQNVTSLLNVGDKQLYYAAKIKLEQAQNLQDLLPFISSLLTIHKLKLLLHEQLDKYVDDNNNNINAINNNINDDNDDDNKDNIISLKKVHKIAKKNQKKDIRSIFMRIGSIDECLPDDVIANVLTFLHSDHYKYLPILNKRFNLLMIKYTNLYNKYNIEIVDDPITLTAQLKNKINIQFNIDHSESEIWIGNKWQQNNLYTSSNSSNNYSALPYEDIFSCKFPYWSIKKWNIKCKRLSYLNNSTNKHCGGNQKIIKILKKASSNIRYLRFNNPAPSHRIFNEYPIFSKCFFVSLNGEIIDNMSVNNDNYFGLNWLNSLNKFPSLQCLEIGSITLNYYSKQSLNTQKEKYKLIKNIIDKCPKLLVLSICLEDSNKNIFWNNDDDNDDNDDDDDDEKYIEWIMPSTIEFLRVHRVLCGINISYCSHIIGFNIENINIKQIKFSDHNHDSSVDCLMYYYSDNVQTSYSSYYQHVDFFDDFNDNNYNKNKNDQNNNNYNDWQKSLLPIQFIGYKNDENNKSNSNDNINNISAKQFIENYIQKINKNKNDINIKCISIGAINENIYEPLMDFHFRNNENLKNIKLKQYERYKSLNVASWIWRFGQKQSNFSYDNLW